VSETRAELLGRRITGALLGHVADMTAYDVRTGEHGRHRGLPTTGITFVLPVGEPIDVAWADRPASRGRRWSCVSGLNLVAADIRHAGTQRGLQLTLTAAGTRALLGVPAAALAAELVTLEELCPSLGTLSARLAEPGSWEERLDRVESVLLAALRHRDVVPLKPEVAHALRLLAAGASVQVVADEVGYSRRHLGALVRAEVGVAPKEYHRLARFERSRPRLLTAVRQGRSLADAAATSGYADQSHLTREWTALAGCPPTTWLREELPFLQESEPGLAAS